MDELPIDQVISRVRSRARRSGRGRHSGIWLFMRANHDTIAETIASDGPNWYSMADELAALGYFDRTGKPGSPSTVRVTWFRVKRFVAAERAKGRRQPAPTPLPGEVARCVVPVRPAEPAPIVKPPVEQPAPAPSPAMSSQVDEVFRQLADSQSWMPRLRRD
jgi:hypothetical protein